MDYQKVTLYHLNWKCFSLGRYERTRWAWMTWTLIINWFTSKVNIKSFSQRKLENNKNLFNQMQNRSMFKINRFKRILSKKNMWTQWIFMKMKIYLNYHVIKTLYIQMIFQLLILIFNLIRPILRGFKNLNCWWSMDLVVPVWYSIEL